MLLHIGYFKTGSTWLQKEIFSDPSLGLRRLALLREIVDDFVLCNPFEFDPDATRARYETRAQETPELLPVLSHERLSGAPISGGVDSREIADRLHATFPNARVLVVVRRQQDVILSSFIQYVRSGGAASLKTFLDLPQRQRGEVPTYDPRFHEYHWLVGYYQQRFGRERVLVLPFEALRRDQGAFVAQLLAHGGRPAIEPDTRGARNVSPGPASIALRRRMNFLFARNSTHLAAPFYFRGANLALVKTAQLVNRALPSALDRAVSARWRRVIDRTVGERFVASNRRLVQQTGLDLATFGYDL